jgi:hypothetical protein
METGESVNRGWSDCQDELVECSPDPKVYCFVDPKFVVATTEVLDEGVPSTDRIFSGL